MFHALFYTSVTRRFKWTDAFLFLWSLYSNFGGRQKRSMLGSETWYGDKGMIKSEECAEGSGIWLRQSRSTLRRGDAEQRTAGAVRDKPWGWMSWAGAFWKRVTVISKARSRRVMVYPSTERWMVWLVWREQGEEMSTRWREKYFLYMAWILDSDMSEIERERHDLTYILRE